jgi:putative ABC transport system permease protein
MLWDIAIKHLWRRKLRSLLTVVGVATSVQMYLTFSGVLVLYRNEINRQLGAFAGKAVVQQQMEETNGNTDLTSSGSSIKPETADALLALKGIDSQASSKLVYVPIARNIMPYMPPAILVVGVEPGHEKAFLSGFKAEAGRLTLEHPDEVILGRSAAQYYRKKDQTAPVKVGETIEIQSHSFVVVGILQSAPQLFNNSVIMPLATVCSVFDRPGAVSSVILTAANVADLPKLKADITARYPDLNVSTQDDLRQSAKVLLDGMNKFFSVIIDSIVVVAIVIVTIVVVVAVMEQRKDIGTLRAVGAGRGRIFSMVAGESLILSLLGAILALPIAVFFTGWGMSEFTGVSGVLSIWLTTILVAMVVGLLATILPAWQALRVDPLEALRYE